MVAPETAQPVFYYDFGHPVCYLAAERVLAELPIVPEWEPIRGGEIGIASPAQERELIEGLATAAGLPPLRWPSPWPPDTHLAALAATYAKQIGRAVAFSLACFRQMFAGGRDPADEHTVLIAGAACEMHPTAVLKAIGSRSVNDALARSGSRALAAGVASLPAIEVHGRVFQGTACLQEAARALEAAA